jgi:outer membrane murein-binding lipoprotein Lpp
MKSTDYRLQKEIQNIKPDNQEWFKDFVRQVLESDKPYYAKADYLGLSIQELQNKIDYLSEDIKQMQALKKNLSSAKATALEAVASVLKEYGIDRLDGTAISSITITPQKTKVKEELIILDENSLIELGYFKAVIDTDAIMQALEVSNKDADSKDDIHRYTQIETSKETTPARIKVNAKRTSVNNQADELLQIVENQEAA